MKDDFECGKFDKLESALIGANVSFGEVSRTYASFLLDLIEEGRLDSAWDDRQLLADCFP
ncbi:MULTISPECIES: hypothetical protein [unclassified Pseudomonas]|uniref:hypothetical protein n=1 Tax=unclassified Pseudomonas TaxID=196821 RepID=UPI001F5901D8|nr:MULTISPECIES: hypothetical protein [unclassified Pseudomonas]